MTSQLTNSRTAIENYLQHDLAANWSQTESGGHRLLWDCGGLPYWPVIVALSEKQKSSQSRHTWQY